MNGEWVKGNKVEDASITYYTYLSGSAKVRSSSVCEEILSNGHVLTVDHQELLLRPVSEDEIFQALFSIPGDKSPRSDGFGTRFFRDTWPIVDPDIIVTIKDFFNSGKL